MGGGLYIHVPYCTSKCSYCAFYSMPRTDTVQAYVEGIVAEYARRRHEIDAPLRTVYIGGGTPSLLSIEALQSICRVFAHEHPDEFTIEVNPDDVTAEKASAWRSLGINRVSMGVQSLDDDMLRTLGRRHTARQAIEAFETLRRAGFDNISVDAILGLPGQSADNWLTTLQRLLALDAEHVSAYILEYEKGSRLSAALQAGRIKPAADDDVARMYEMLCSTTAMAGYEHYEISNFAKPGRHSLHNSSYWDNVPYLGLGPAAHSFDGSTRRYNEPSLAIWLRGEALRVDEETAVDRLNDRLMTALRTARGFDYTTLSAERLRQLRVALCHIAADQITDTGTHIVINEHAWLLADAITSALLFD